MTGRGPQGQGRHKPQRPATQAARYKKSPVRPQHGRRWRKRGAK